MKKLLILLLLLVPVAHAGDLVTDKLATAAVGSSDTAATVRHNTSYFYYNTALDAGKDHSYYWPSVEVTSIDTNFTNDTVFLVLWHGAHSGTPVWTLFDTTTIVPGANDTITQGTRINMDSSTYMGSYWRGIISYSRTLADSDSTLVGNKYPITVKAYLEGR